MTTPPNSKTKRDRKAQKKNVRLLPMRAIENVSVIFFAQVNIEVTRGHRRSILAKCHIIFPEKFDYLRTYYRQQATEESTRQRF